MKFITNCTNARGCDIEAMTDSAMDVSRRTFLRHVDQVELASVSAGLGYELHPSRGLTMGNDAHVTYHRSKYRGRRCYYFRWSAIEYIFQRVPL